MAIACRSFQTLIDYLAEQEANLTPEVRDAYLAVREEFATPPQDRAISFVQQPPEGREN